MNVTLNAGYGLGNTLTCPCCNEEYLHHGTVTVFDRNEDAPFVRKTTVADYVGVASVDNESSGNPSGRRTGLTIEFWCETCGGCDEDGNITKPMLLHILQNKGNTYLHWEVLTA